MAGHHHQHLGGGGQLEVKTDLLNYIIAIVLITVGLAAALALGLGSREVAGQTGCRNLRPRAVQVGQQVKVGDVEGTIRRDRYGQDHPADGRGRLQSLANVYCSISGVTSR